MQFTTAFVAASAALTASALPQTTPIAADAKFGILAIHSGSDIQNTPFQAALSSIIIGANSQNASCDAPTNSATFYLQDSELKLFAESATPQSLFVDRSGMGQGKVGFVTGAQPLPSNAETKGWAIDDKNVLSFNGEGLQACPNSIDGAWSVWLSGTTNPAGNSECIGISPAVQVADPAIGCSYTS
ncbi:hypothetical protein P280DRAFT_297933 [Massarina eburnea CBS 473.64]|uniref:Cell wall protein PhiA n=1 Tax=Massarina eburnea CBS 473.64 TaxID=1395130 RepID=A0A6A6RFV4_9PLEO|nr:hypothetical protein P280DRAFT_297933 [Massarina eburnea CBS 473.64]